MNESEIKRISHDLADENFEEKVKWFQSLTVEERLDVFFEYVDLIMEINPNIVKERYAEQFERTVHVLEKE